MNQRGFTLIEMMMVIAIIGIISAIAYPGYQAYALKTGRADGKAKMLEILQAQERFYSQNQTYTLNLGAGGLGYGFAANAPVTSDERRYTITAAACGAGIASCVTLTATRAGTQINDNQCGNLTLDSQGIRGESGSLSIQDCW